MTVDSVPPVADFTGQRVLLFAPRFFGYERELAEELRRRGAEVDLLADRPFGSPFYHVAARLSRKSVLGPTERWYRRRLGTGTGYDHVWVVNGQTVSRGLVEWLRARNPAARFTYYLWDSLANRGAAVRELIGLFDRAATFEPESARALGVAFRPLFAVPAFSEPRGEPIRYDISFIGTAHSSRWKVVRAIDASLPARVRRFWYLFLQARWVFWARRAATPALRGARADDFRYVPLSRDESAAVFWASRAILDVEHPGQTGLTIRTFEALAAGKKLVTTNPAIRDYALYDPARVCVIDRAAPVVPEDFLTTDAAPLDTVSARRYSLAGFIDEIFAEGDRSELHLAAPSSTAARRAAA